MRNLPIIAILLVILYVVQKLVIEPDINSQATLLIGVMLISSFLLAKSINPLRLPRLTGYMIMGVILGPLGFNFLTSEMMEQIEFLENIALSFIAITAGGEFKLKEFYKNKKSLLLIFISQVLFVFAGVMILFLIMARFIPVLSNLDRNIVFGFAILFAATAVSTSPAATIGIITETESKGKVTDSVLSVTILKTVFLVLSFPLVIAWAKIYLSDQTFGQMNILQDVLTLIGGSVLTGIILGALIIWYIKKIKYETSLFMLAVVITIAEISMVFSLEILLTSIIVGFVVSNFCKEGYTLIKEIELFSLPIYVIFFCFAGANLHIDVIFKAFAITVFLIIARTLFLYIGNLSGAILAGETRFMRNYTWMGYIGQAGIALGLAIIIERTFPGAIGKKMLTILISTVIINEIMGPIFFRYILVKAREVKGTK